MKELNYRFIILSFMAIIPFAGKAQVAPASKISQTLQSQIASAPEEFHEIYILLSEQTDLEAMTAAFVQARTPLDERARKVIGTLKANAAKHQPVLMERLQMERGIAKGTVRPYWIANMFYAKANAAAIAALSQWKEIMWLQDVPVYEPAVIAERKPALPAPNGRERGLDVINAPSMWRLGYTGYGRKAYIYDTGVDIEHPAVSTHFSFNNFPLEYSWLGVEREPYICGDHGTHVTGTTLGLDRLTQDTIGVAFNATWMASAQFTTCGDKRVDETTAIQWALDPDNDANTTAEMPDVMNMSGGRTINNDMLCFDPLLKARADAFEAMGVAAVYAAGNEGPGEMTQRSPAVHNWSLVKNFAIGNINANNIELPINGSSSRGPSHCIPAEPDSSLMIKPEVSAPGTDVRSCVSNGNYELYTGTSMAAPHTTGAILLLKEAFPYLAGQDLQMALYRTARDLGSPGEDNIFGNGVIDVYAAYLYLIDLGHVPVPPVVAANDVLIAGIDKSAVFTCGNSFDFTFYFENAGTDTLTTLEVDVLVEHSSHQFTLSQNWSGILPPSGRDQMTFSVTECPDCPNGTELPRGAFLVTIQLKNPNGQPDEKALNNNLKTKFFLSPDKQVQAHIENQNDLKACLNTRAKLVADYDGPGSVRWFETAGGLVPRARGKVFITPKVTRDLTYYTDIVYDHLGIESPYYDDSALGDETTGSALFFEVFSPIHLNRVKMYATATGFVNLELCSENGQNCKEKQIGVRAGENNISINFRDIGPGKYQLRRVSGPHLLYTTTEAQFPYHYDKVLSITHSDHPNNRYLYFYDWETELADRCPRASIKVSLNPAAVVPVVNFTSPDTLYLSGGIAEATFINQSEGALLDLHWDFGDGTTSTDTMPTHVFTTLGRYFVTLTARNVFNCADSWGKQILVLDGRFTDVREPHIQPKPLRIFPNPTASRISVQLPETIAREGSCHVFDMLGRRVLNGQLDALSKSGDTIELEVSDLRAGMYQVYVRQGEKGYWGKFVKY